MSFHYFLILTFFENKFIEKVVCTKIMSIFVKKYIMAKFKKGDVIIVTKTSKYYKRGQINVVKQNGSPCPYVENKWNDHSIDCIGEDNAELLSSISLDRIYVKFDSTDELDKIATNVSGVGEGWLPLNLNRRTND